MSSSIWALALVISLGADPYGGCQTCNNGGAVGGFASGGYATGGYPAGGYGGASYSGGTGGGIYSTGMGLNGYSGSNGDQLHPWDTQEAWMHGYFQEIGPYAGYHFYRPYNYKHVFAQADLAYRWGQPQGMPYSQQWWHRYHGRASLNPTMQSQMSQASSSYEVEMGRLRAWRDFQAEQQRMTQSQPVQYQAPQQYSGAVPNQTQIIIDPATQAAMEQQQGARGYVVPAAPTQNFPRSNSAPVIQEFNPQYAPSGPALR